MPVFDKRAPVRFGGSIGLSNSITMRRDSRARLPLNMGHVMGVNPPTPNVNTCVPCDDATGAQRTNLINMKCRYFHSFSGCTRADCRFLHEEKPQDVVFHDGNERSCFRSPVYIAPGPRVDVKIFIGNLPPGTLSSFVVDIASPFGEVKECKVLRSNLRNGRCPAVLFMSSDAQADAAIDALNAYTDANGQRPYARKEYSRPDSSTTAPPTRLQNLLNGTKVATSMAKRVPIDEAGKARVPIDEAGKTVKAEHTPKKIARPALNNADPEGYTSPKKSIKIARTFHDPLKLSTAFMALVDLPEDWDADYDDDEPPEPALLADKEVATLTPTKPPSFKSMPTLTPMTSPVSTITGVWAGADTTRKERVMSPFPVKMPPPAMSQWDGWRMLGPSEYSDS